MKTHLLTISTILIVFNSLTIAQENRFSFELNTGASYATRSLGGTDLNIGGGFEGIFAFKLMPHVQLLGGWGWNKFTAEESFAGPEMDFEETGYIFGLQFKHPIPKSDLLYFVRFNGLYNHIEIENNDGDIIDDTGHGIGWQIASGIAIPVNSKWTLTPGIKFNSLNRSIESTSYSKSLQQNYISLRVGMEYKF
jgi:opacity protein-like surface antigen